MKQYTDVTMDECSNVNVLGLILFLFSKNHEASFWFLKTKNPDEKSSGL